MAEVRTGVDAVDVKLIELLACRFAYMDAAARIKTDKGAVRDEARKRQVLKNVVAMAEQQHVPPQLIEQLWEQLVEASIAYELVVWDDLRR